MSNNIISTKFWSNESMMMMVVFVWV